AAAAASGLGAHGARAAEDEGEHERCKREETHGAPDGARPGPSRIALIAVTCGPRSRASPAPSAASQAAAAIVAVPSREERRGTPVARLRGMRRHVTSLAILAALFLATPFAHAAKLYIAWDSNTASCMAHTIAFYQCLLGQTDFNQMVSA